MKIALDVMGGDHAPQNPMGGVKLALEELPQIEKIYLVGVPEVIEQEMQRLYAKLKPLHSLMVITTPEIYKYYWGRITDNTSSAWSKIHFGH